MLMKFNIPEFRPGLNVTVRNRDDKYLDVVPGTEIDVVQTDAPEKVLGIGQIVETVPLNWRKDQDRIAGLTMFNHESGARDIPGLAQALNRAYGLNNWGPDVVVVLFVVQDALITPGDQDISFGGAETPADPTPPVFEHDVKTELDLSTVDEAPSAPQEDPVPRADEPEASPITKICVEAGAEWAYRMTPAGIEILYRLDEDSPWQTDGTPETWPLAVVHEVERLNA